MIDIDKLIDLDLPLGIPTGPIELKRVLTQACRSQITWCANKLLEEAAKPEISSAAKEALTRVASEWKNAEELTEWSRAVRDMLVKLGYKMEHEDFDSMVWFIVRQIMAWREKHNAADSGEGPQDAELDSLSRAILGRLDKCIEPVKEHMRTRDVAFLRRRLLNYVLGIREEIWDNAGTFFSNELKRHYTYP